MPKINNLRIINAQFNEAKREFQDLRMPFYGESATYELINGGGKSVLLMLLLQCVIPNSSLDRKKPFKDIFRGGNPNRTTHVLVEWELDEGLYEHKYLLTGFCAKKNNNPDDLDKNGTPDYFNYTHLYDKPNDFDIHRIPLCRSEDDEFVVMDLSKTREMLKEKCGEYDIWIAESKRAYMERIKKFNLLEAEIDLIRRINKKENYLKSHFTENYGTSRALIEKLLLNTTERCLKSKKSFYNDESTESSSESLAGALYQSQEDIKRLKEEMEKLEEYEKLDREVQDIRSANNEVIEKFRMFEDTKKQASSQIQTYKVRITGKRTELVETTSELEHTKRQHTKTELDIERFEIMKLNVGVNIGQRELNQLETERKGIQNDIEKLDNDINLAIATNKYLNILEFEEKIHQDKKTLENTKKEHEELFEQRKVVGQKLHYFLKREHDKIEKQYSNETKKLDAIRTDFYEHQKHIGKIEGEQEQKQKELSRIRNKKDELNKKEVQLQAEYVACPKITGGMILKDEIVATANRVIELNEKSKQLDDEIHQEINHLTKKEEEYKRIDSEIKHIWEKFELAEKSHYNFKSQKNVVLKISTLRGFESLESCLEQIEKERTETNETVLNLVKEKERLELEITTIKEHGSPLSMDMENALKWFRSEFSFAKTGAEYLKDLAEDKQKEILNNAPWLTKSIILTKQDFNRIVYSPTSILPVSIMDSSVILTNHSSLQEQKKLSLGDIFVPSRDSEHYIKILDPETIIKRIEKEIEKVGQNIDKYKDILGMADDDRDTIRLFHDKYPVEFEAEVQQEISDYRGSIEEHDANLSVISKSIVDIQATLKQMGSEKEKIQDELTTLNENMVTHKKLDEVIDTLTELELSLKECESNIKELDGKYRQTDDQKSRLESELKGKESLVTSFRDRVNEIKRELKPLESFAIVGIEDLQEEDIKKLQPEFDSLDEVIAKVAGDASSLEKSIEQKNDFIDNLWEDIQRTKINKEMLQSTQRKVPYPNEHIEQLEKSKVNAELKFCEADNIFGNKNKNQIRLVAGFEDGINRFKQKYMEAFLPDENLLADIEFDAKIKNKADEKIRLFEHIRKLDSLHLTFETELNNLQNNYDRYKDLDSFYQFSDIEAVLVEELIYQNEMASLLKNSSDKVDRSKEIYESTRGKSIDVIRKLRVPPDFIATIKDKLKTAGSFREAEQIEKNLNEYSMIIETKTQVQRQQVESLKDVEEKVISQALGIIKIYRDYLKRFPSLSRIILDGRSTEMIRINFNECEYTDDMAISEMRHYIQQLIEDIETQKISQKELIEYLTPGHLINKVLDMKNISLSIRKIDTNDTRFQRWEKIQASDGQENAMFIIFMVVLMSYIRDIVVDRKDKNTSKVLIIDNPFGLTSACYLWEKIAAILEKNNVQIICPGHKISPSVMEYFPVRHVLTEETSTDGRTRVNVKTTAKDEIMDRIKQQQRYGQLMLENCV